VPPKTTASDSVATFVSATTISAGSAEELTDGSLNAIRTAFVPPAGTEELLVRIAGARSVPAAEAGVVVLLSPLNSRCNTNDAKCRNPASTLSPSFAEVTNLNT